MTNSRKTSLIQARYALSILRVAEGSDRDVALRLVEAVAGDLPLSDVTREQSEAHFAAIDSFGKLADSLRQNTSAPPPWKAAFNAVDTWLSTAE